VLTAGARTRNGACIPGTGTRSLAAGAVEDRAALSGRPRKANAGQYTRVMPQPDFTQRRPRLPPRGAVALLGAAGLIGARRRKA
jgi:hypothetical protein